MTIAPEHPPRVSRPRTGGWALGLAIAAVVPVALAWLGAGVLALLDAIDDGDIGAIGWLFVAGLFLSMLVLPFAAILGIVSIVLAALARRFGVLGVAVIGVLGAVVFLALFVPLIGWPS